MAGKLWNASEGKRSDSEFNAFFKLHFLTQLRDRDRFPMYFSLDVTWTCHMDPLLIQHSFSA